MKKFTVASRLKQAMALRNMRQVELSEITGITKSALSQYMSGKIVPRQDKIYILAKALNVNEGWLLGYEIFVKQQPNPESLPKLNISDARKIEDDLQNMIESVESANFSGAKDHDDLEALKSTLKTAMILAKKLAKKKYSPQ